MPVTYHGAGTAQNPAGAVDKITVPFPAATVEGQAALLVVVGPSFLGYGLEVANPPGWDIVGRRSGLFNTIYAFGRQVPTSGPSPIVVDVGDSYGNNLADVSAQIFVFNNVVRFTRRALAITVPAGNAGFWITGGTFVGGVPPAIDGLDDFNAGYIIAPSSPSKTFYNPEPANIAAGNMGIEIEQRPGPDTPIPVAPISGAEASTAEAVPFSWVHQGFRPQASFQLLVRKTADSPTWSYVKADGTITTTETTITSSDQGFVVPAASFLAVTPYQWAVKTREIDGPFSPLSPVNSFTLVAPPTVTVTGPSAPVVDDLSPLVTWSSVMSGGRVQIAFQVKVRSQSGTLLYDSGVTLGNQTSWQVPALSTFTNGENVTYEVYVTQTGGARGLGTAVQPISWTPPADPEMAVTPEEPGVRIEIESPPDTVLDVQASTDGSTWRSVTTGQVVITSPTTVRDVLATFGVPTTYRVRAAELLDGMKLTTEWVYSEPVESIDDEFYLVDSINPQNWIAPIFQSATGDTYVRGGTISYPLGARGATIDYGTVQGDSGSIRVSGDSAEADAAIFRMLTLNRPLWVRWHPDNICSADGSPAILIAVTPESLPHGRRFQEPVAWRDWDFNWVEQNPDDLPTTLGIT